MGWGEEKRVQNCSRKIRRKNIICDIYNYVDCRIILNWI
jgi:hypothetical protein